MLDLTHVSKDAPKPSKSHRSPEAYLPRNTAVLQEFVAHTSHGALDVDGREVPDLLKNHWKRLVEMLPRFILLLLLVLLVVLAVLLVRVVHLLHGPQTVDHAGSR